MRSILFNSMKPRDILRIASVMLFGASALSAADPLTGTWRLDPSETKHNYALQMTYVSIASGVSVQSGQRRSTDYVWDGKDHPFGIGTTTVNTVRIDNHSFVITSTRSDEKAGRKQTITASKNGKHLTRVDESTIDGKPSKRTRVYNRVGRAPSGDGFLGAWEEDISKRLINPPQTISFTVDGDTLDYAEGRTHVYTAKCDGKDYKRDSDALTVRLKRIDDHTIEELMILPSGGSIPAQYQVKGDVLIKESTIPAPNGDNPNTIVYHYNLVK